MRLKLLVEFEERLRIIKYEHECELKRREERDRKRYEEIIRKTWETYIKRFREVEFVKEVRFSYVEQVEEREIWGQFVKCLDPELVKFVPCKFEPAFCVEDSRNGSEPKKTKGKGCKLPFFQRGLAD